MVVLSAREKDRWPRMPVQCWSSSDYERAAERERVSVVWWKILSVGGEIQHDPSARMSVRLRLVPDSSPYQLYGISVT